MANVKSPYVTEPEGEARTEQVYAYDATDARVTLERNIVTGATKAPAPADPEG